MEEYTESIYNFTSMGMRESIAMRIIAVVTLIYLPATFVSVSFDGVFTVLQNALLTHNSHSSALILSSIKTRTRTNLLISGTVVLSLIRPSQDGWR